MSAWLNGGKLSSAERTPNKNARRDSGFFMSETLEEISPKRRHHMLDCKWGQTLRDPRIFLKKIKKLEY